MIFLPNKFERYTAAFRNLLHSKALQNGISPKITNKLKKIYIAEAIYYNENLPYELNEFLNSLLTFAKLNFSLQGIDFSFFIEGNGAFLINKELLISYILNISKTTHFIKFQIKNDKLVLKYKPFKYCDFLQFNKIVKPLTLRELSSGYYFVSVPLMKTDQNPLKLKKNCEAFCNPFSIINIYLKSE